jgi:hypothetical protein
MLLKSDGKFGNKYLLFKLELNELKINEDYTQNDGNQRSESFYSPTLSLHLSEQEQQRSRTF